MRGRIWLVMGLFGLLILAACVSWHPRPPAPVIVWPSATPAPMRGPLWQEQDAGTPIPARQVLIPLYQYPKRYLTPAATDTWTLAASANFSNTIMAVIDPICNSWMTGSGGPTCGKRQWESPHPGSGVPDSNMTTGMQELATAGVLQLGYVSTYFGAQTITDIKGQIDLYATSPYTAFVSGIFFDEVHIYTDPTYYTEIAAYAYAAGLDYVVFNLDGWTDYAESYFSTPTVNLGVMFEGFPAAWASYVSPSGTPPAWLANYPRENFAAVILDTSAGNLTARLTEAYNRNYGVIFITDAASYTAAYEMSPSYLPTEVAQWRALLGTAGPTATTAPTATPGPYLSPTPTPPSTATTAPTPTPAPQVPWSELICPTLAVTVDGALTEWAAIVPYTLTTTSAAYMWPDTTPVTLTGVFRCAHSGALLYLSGVITDTTVVSPTGSLENGDAARIVLDGQADGDFRHLLDDHDLLIGSNGAVRDFEVYPIGAVAATLATAGGWQFEVSVPLATLEASTAVGEIVGLIFGIHDSIGGATWAHILTGTKRTGRLE